MTTTDIGRIGERLAVKYLKKHRYKILEKNIHLSHNEVDIIATDKDYLVFVEVKTRSVDDNDAYSPYGTPASAVTAAKQKRTVSAARSYILKNSKSKHSRKQPRMDVIEVYLSKTSHKLIKLNHITDAFGAD